MPIFIFWIPGDGNDKTFIQVKLAVKHTLLKSKSGRNHELSVVSTAKSFGLKQGKQHTLQEIQAFLYEINIFGYMFILLDRTNFMLSYLLSL